MISPSSEVGFAEDKPAAFSLIGVYGNFERKLAVASQLIEDKVLLKP